jgi:hypothetical protein
VALAAYLVLLAVLGLAALGGAALLVRALIRTREEGPPPGWALVLAATVLLAIPVAAVCAYRLLPAPVSDRGLTNSMERETGSNTLFESDCDEIRDGRWRCNVYDASASGTSDYDVGSGWSCWHARRIRDNAEVPMPARPEGCTTLRDTAGLFDSALELLD